MKTSAAKRFYAWSMMLALLVFGNSAFACTACFGDPNSDATKGVIAAIWLLLFVVGGVLSLIAGFFVYQIRRASKNPVLPAGQVALAPLNSK